MSTEGTLRAAAQAVLDRWDSPQWQWTKQSPTADLMANLRAALDADLNVQVKSAITQVQAVHAAFNAGALQQPAASGEPVAATTLYVEVRECPECQHIDINDDNDQAACTHCDWHGPSPEADHCPGCGADGTMTTACIKCGHRTTLLGRATLPVPAATAQPAPARVPPDVLRDAELWRYVATHWTNASFKWNRDAGNTPKSVTVTIATANAAIASNGGQLRQFISECMAAAPDAQKVAPQACPCFPGTCRGGEVINGRLANGQVCAAAAGGA